jgi:diguanylate cyclase (GGDEF)-like protein/PAS domain S-box-containing protein
LSRPLPSLPPLTAALTLLHAPLSQAGENADVALLNEPLWLGLAVAGGIAAYAFNKLRSSHHRQRMLFDTAPLAILVWSASDRKIVDANRAASRLLGWPVEQLRGKDFLTTLLPSTDHQLWQDSVQPLQHSDRVWDVQTPVCTAAGINQPCEWHTARYGRQHGDNLLISIAEDISERQHMEQSLRDSEGTLRSFFDNSLIGIAATNPEQILTETNPALCQMLGYPREELLGRRISDFAAPEQVAEDEDAHHRMLAGDIDSARLIRRFSRKDGGIMHAQMDVRCVRKPDGRADHFVAIVDDITERHNTEIRLQASEERLRRIVDELPMAMMRTNQGRIEYVNRKLTAMLGYIREDIPLLSTWYDSAFPDADYRHFAIRASDKLMEVARNKANIGIPIELRVRAKHGADVEVEFLYAEFGEFGIWTLNDVTERNRSEHALLQANLSLQDQLAEIRLLQEQLREQATHDALTHLYNRRYLDETLERELARALREGYPLTVAMLDIDHFKQLNDTYGHQAGDEVLKSLAEILLRNSRTSDIACRYGGEEFILVLPNMPLEAAARRAEQWRREFAENVTLFGQFELQSTISIGLAAFPGHGKNRDTLLEAADQALYSAKRSGRNRVVVFNFDQRQGDSA